MGSFSRIFCSKKLSFFLNLSFLFLLSFYITVHVSPTNQIESSSFSSSRRILHQIKIDGCKGLHNLTNYEAKCKFVSSEVDCRPRGYINYIGIFYCTCGKYQLLGFGMLLLWLLVLFYISGDTVSNYFCSSLENLSQVLKLSPTIAGVTLLSLGNGAGDVFASIVSFGKSGNGDVGLNAVVGGAFFVSSAVLGIIGIVTSPYKFCIDKHSFIRDVLFLLLAILALFVIILVGKINLFGAICFVSIYIFYVCVVYVSHYIQSKKTEVVNILSSASCLTSGSLVDSPIESNEIGIPLLGYVDEEKGTYLVDKPSNPDDEDQSLGNWLSLDPTASYCLSKFLYVLELPIFLPRRLTIPVVNEEKWSKPYAVISVTLAPILLAALSQTEKFDANTNLIIYIVAVIIGIGFGNLAFATTKSCCPPKKCLLAWLVGGFLMSITWTYITAEELVSLLVSFGTILGINPSILALTVLAWGNSLGDLIANLTMAKGGFDGAQIAVSGCLAGPIFNTLIGLGVSLVFSTWSEYPASFVIPKDPSLYETVGFFMSGLLWSLVILPRREMRLDKFLGGGLLAIYLCFLSLRLARASGLLNSHE